MKVLFSILFFSSFTFEILANKVINGLTETLTFSGKALSIKNNSLFYIETHNEIKQEDKHTQTEIIYTNESGIKIGYKTLDFSKFYTSPNYKLEDQRAKYREGAEIKNGQVSVYYQYTEKEKKPTTKLLNVPQPIVIDGGFNYFVKQNWDQLMNGKILTFNFVSPAKLDYFVLRLSKKQNLIYNNKKASLIYLELDNIFLRLLLTPIKITYDNQTKRILKYEGIANLSDKDGKNENVQLVFPDIGP
jgi:hypothetical protein